MNNHQKGFAPIMIILIALVVVGGGGVLAWKYKLVEKISSPTQTENPSPTQIVTPKTTVLLTPSVTSIIDETASWKIYANKYTNYQIKYPDDWQAVDKTSTNQSPGYYIEFYDSKGKSKNYFTVMSGGSVASDFVKWDIVSKEKIRIGGADTQKITFLPTQPVEQSVSQYDLPAADRVITIADFGKNNLQYRLDFYIFDGNLGFADKVISTFKFIEGKDETADWKTYTNNQYGFEVKYSDDSVPTADNYSKEFIWLKSKSQPEITEPFIAVGKEKYTLFFQGTWAPVPYSEAESVKIVSSESVTINGILFNKDRWSIRPGVEAVSYNTNHNGKYYTIYRGVSDGANKSETTFNLMLATFKFLD